MFSGIKKMIPSQRSALPLLVAMVNLSRTKLQVFVCVRACVCACACLCHCAIAGVSERVIKIRPNRCQDPLPRLPLMSAAHPPLLSARVGTMTSC